MSRKLVAIHQPNFLPWLGYFDKIARADVFLLMDNVQFSKSSKGTWTNRVKLMVGREVDWITVPVRRDFSGTRLVHEMQINDDPPWRQKMLKQLQHSYGRAPFFDQVFRHVEATIAHQTTALAELTEAGVRRVVEALGLPEVEIIRGSTLDVAGQGTELLISMVRAVGGSAYLCGGGAAGYQEDELFAEAGIDLVYQEFEHPEYAQHNMQEFVPGLSIIDAMMNIGIEASAKLIGV